MLDWFFWWKKRKPHKIKLDATVVLEEGLTMQVTGTITFIIEPAANPIVIGNSTFNGRVGEPITGNLNISGGTPPYSVFVTDAAQMPPGVSIDSAGEVSGVPETAGTFQVGVQVNDSGA